MAMPDLVAFRAGTFVMGDDTVPTSREAPSHTVELEPFALGRCCVTAGEYFEFIKGAGDSFSEAWCDYIDPCFIVRTGAGLELRPGTARFPMVQVSYLGSAAYCNWLSLADGLEPVYDVAAGTGDVRRNGYRLPTEAEWEFACLSGLGQPGEGDAIPDGVNYRDAVLPAGVSRADEMRAGGFAFPPWSPVEVGSLPPDLAGLHEMLGNVREWCHDRYVHYQAGSQRGPTGGTHGYYRVVRGGSFLDPPQVCHPRVRAAVHEDNKCMQYGFRVARSLS
jgi:formylglycine-generating enzyme